jgi:Cu(I)/Ag(I) efflux system protein CusF
MKTAILGIALSAALTAAPVIAQQSTNPGAQQLAAATQAADKPSELTDGEVRKVDKDANKLTIRHGPIKNLDMPPMTMVFQVKDPAMLDQVKPGDKIRFAVDKLAGAFTVLEIEPAK